jgi:hypothetical protein
MYSLLGAGIFFRPAGIFGDRKMKKSKFSYHTFRIGYRKPGHLAIFIFFYFFFFFFFLNSPISRIFSMAAGMFFRRPGCFFSPMAGRGCFFSPMARWLFCPWPAGDVFFRPWRAGMCERLVCRYECLYFLSTKWLRRARAPLSLSLGGRREGGRHLAGVYGMYVCGMECVCLPY